MMFLLPCEAREGDQAQPTEGTSRVQSFASGWALSTVLRRRSLVTWV